MSVQRHAPASAPGSAWDDIRRSYWKARASIAFRATLLRLAGQNATCRTPVVGDGPAVVSLTTHGRRVTRVHLAIESIASGQTRPKRMVLWVNDASIAHHPPPPLKRLADRGLEIRVSENFGPHTKYYPHVESEKDFAEPLVTADDDVIYPEHWLSSLVAAARTRPSCVNCHRARVFAMTGEGPAPYTSWPLCKSGLPSLRHFALGVCGVIYPAQFLDIVRRSGRRFLEVTPRNDDVWLHLLAVRNRVPVCQVSAAPAIFHTIPGSQAAALHLSNFFGGGNDAQIGLAYSKDDLDVLRAVDAGAHVASAIATFP
jgi:hypothetical protein